MTSTTGTLQNFETRLLLSSAQVEYMRYWLHAMKMTKDLIPLPYSDCLLTESSLRHVSPVQYRTKEDLRTALRVSRSLSSEPIVSIPIRSQKIDKNNKRLKGVDPTLNARRDIFERVRSFWAQKRGTWCALDFEAWDRDHSLLTEFGWSLIRWDGDKEITEQGHLTVKEHKYYTNTFVADNREVGVHIPAHLPWYFMIIQHFAFGKSEQVNKATFKQRIQALLEGLKQLGPLFLVFHDNNQDIKLV